MKELKPLFKAHIEQVTKLYYSAMEKTGYDCLIIHSGITEYRFLDDMNLAFKVNAHFNYFVPVTNNPDCFLILESGKKPKLLYHLVSDYWHIMPEQPSGYWVDFFDIVIISTPHDVHEYLPTNTSGTVYIGGHGVQFKTYGIKQINPPHLMNLLHYDRARKTEYELECMREASKIGVAGHLAAKEAFYNGGSEFDIHIAYLKGASTMECDLPYMNIIALNEHAAVLHYQVMSPKKFAEKDRHSFLIDAGGQFKGYASDITRTYSYRPDEFADMIDMMDREHLELITKLKVGDPYPDTHLRAHLSIAKILSHFKLVDLPADAIVEKGISSTFFPHGIGHLLGLQVHDIAGFAKNSKGDLLPKPKGHPYLRLTRHIEDGFVFTIEPGLYFIQMLLDELKATENSKYINWDKIDTLKKYGGIRIEDNILVTKTGTENLTRHAFL